MPGVMAEGATPDECVKAVREALAATVAHHMETGLPVPPPASDPKRTEQVNVRLTADERAAIEAAAQRLGHRSLSDFVRAVAVERAEAREASASPADWGLAKAPVASMHSPPVRRAESGCDRGGDK